jgi:predicted oxidoreductase
MLLNKNGLRYIDESTCYTHDFGWFGGAALERQPETTAYALMDEKIKNYLIKKRQNICGVEDVHGRVAAKNQQGNIEKGTSKELRHDDPLAWWDELEKDIKSEAKEGRLKISNSLSEIAEWIGADPEVFVGSVQRYNRYSAEGRDGEFLKPTNFLLPIDTPPYYCIMGREGIDTCIGGIRINHRMEVLNKHFKPVGGLYASGVATSGWLGHGYGYWGSEFSFSMFSGFAAGKLAAEYSKSRS